MVVVDDQWYHLLPTSISTLFTGKPSQQTSALESSLPGMNSCTPASAQSGVRASWRTGGVRLFGPGIESEHS